MGKEDVKQISMKDIGCEESPKKPKKQSLNPMTEQENIDWIELCEYVHHQILKNDEDTLVNKRLVLRLKGLHEGKFMTNNKTKPMAKYPFDIILMTFKIHRFEIINAISNKNKFKDEAHIINYMMVIIESNINETYLRVKKVKKAQEKAESIELDIPDEEHKAKYTRKTKDITNSILKDLMFE